MTANSTPAQAALDKIRPASAAWLRFAQECVSTAKIVDDATAATVSAAIASVPRNLFVEPAFHVHSFQDQQLPIGFNQFMCKPSLVARFLSLIGLREGMRILEIGCGSGYCSALMTAAGAQVYATEIVGLLAQQTRKRLDRLNLQTVLVRRGDGRRGWAEHAPYDAIISWAALEKVEPELLQQLQRPEGRLVLPLIDAKSPQGPQKVCLWEARGREPQLYQLEACEVLRVQS
jgi:protein-L-isoaspartate(D-aspartate) O-methyltransferase